MMALPSRACTLALLAASASAFVGAPPPRRVVAVAGFLDDMMDKLDGGDSKADASGAARPLDRRTSALAVDGTEGIAAAPRRAPRGSSPGGSGRRRDPSCGSGVPVETPRDTQVEGRDDAGAAGDLEAAAGVGRLHHGGGRGGDPRAVPRPSGTNVVSRKAPAPRKSSHTVSSSGRPQARVGQQRGRGAQGGADEHRGRQPRRVEGRALVRPDQDGDVRAQARRGLEPHGLGGPVRGARGRQAAVRFVARMLFL